MPYKDPAAQAAYYREFSRRPHQRARQARNRLLPGYQEYLNRVRRNAFIKRTYGITQDDYLAMLEAQGGRCAICKRPDNYKSKWFDIDHCHTTKRVRGLLCRNCNKGLGNFKDDVSLMTSAIGYIKSSAKVRF